MKILFWDLELLKPLEDNGGWAGAKRGDCGISVVCIYDSETSRFHLYDQKNLDDAVDHLNSADLLVGFNTIDFDTTVIQAVTGRYLTVQQWDILQAIWDALGYKQKGWKLGELTERTFGFGKSGNGEFATTLAAKEEWGKLFTYCLGDVHLVREVWNHLADGQPLTGPDDKPLHLQPPVQEHA